MGENMMEVNKGAQMEGMFLIIDHGNVKGLKHWTNEFERRGMPAVIQTNEQMVTEHSDMIRNLSAKGFEICGAYNMTRSSRGTLIARIEADA